MNATQVNIEQIAQNVFLFRKKCILCFRITGYCLKTCVAAIGDAFFVRNFGCALFIYRGIRMEFNTVNERMKYYRRLFGYKQSDIAEKLGMPTSTYSAKERVGNIDCDFLINFSQVLGIDPSLVLFTEKPQVKTEMPTFELSDREEGLVKMYRNVTKSKKDIIFKFVYDLFKNK